MHPEDSEPPRYVPTDMDMPQQPPAFAADPTLFEGRVVRLLVALGFLVIMLPTLLGTVGGGLLLLAAPLLFGFYVMPHMPRDHRWIPIVAYWCAAVVVLLAV